MRNRIARFACAVFLMFAASSFAQVDKAQAQILAGQLAEAEATLLAIPMRTAEVWKALGWLYDRQGLLLRSEQAYLQALAVMTPPTDRQLYVRTSIGLATVYIEMEQYAKAEAIVARLLEHHPDATPSEQAALSGYLGVIFAQRGQLQAAAGLFSGVSARCSNTKAAGDPELWEVCAIALANYAEVRLRSNDTPGALASFASSLEMMEAVPNPNPPTLAATLANYAAILASLGNRAEAEALYRKGSALAESRLGPTHPVLGELLTGYAKILAVTGRKAEARRLRQTAARIQALSAKENATGHTVDVHTLRAR